MYDKVQHQIKRLIYRLRHDYLTLNNVVLSAAMLIALGWTWGSVEVMQQNYDLQRSVDTKRRQLSLEELHVATLELEGRYYNSLEYQELAVRERLGLGAPGESVVIVPSTEQAVAPTADTPTRQVEASNFQEWANFIFGDQDLQQ